MRILYLVHQFMPDFAAGTERVTLNLARGAQSEGHAVEVLTVTHRVGEAGGGGWRRDQDGFLTASVQGVPVTAVAGREQTLTDLGYFANPDLAEAVARFLKARPAFDVVHVMHALRMTEAVELIGRLRIPYVATITDFFSICHRVSLVRVSGALCDGPKGGEACRAFCAAGELEEGAYAARLARYRAILERASAVVAVSEYVARQVRTEHPDLGVGVIGNGVDLLRFAPRPRAPRRGPLTVGYLGTVSAAKGALTLARGFAAAGAIDARLRIVGPVAEPEVAAEIQRLAENAAISLEGPVEAQRAPQLLAEFDLLAVPSQVPESFSLALHEGFAAGLPALVSDLGNIGEVIRASGAGMVVEAADEGAWARVLAETAARPERIEAWAERLPLPWRIEEEAFLYSQLYQAAAGVSA